MPEVRVSVVPWDGRLYVDVRDLELAARRCGWHEFGDYLDRLWEANKEHL